MISNLFLVYLLLTLSTLLLNKTSSVAQVLRFFHIPLETGRRLKVHKSHKRSFFKFYVLGDCCMRNQNNVLEKCQDYNKTIHVKLKVNVLKIKWRESLTRKPSLFKARSRHILFLHLSSLKPLRSTQSFQNCNS